MWKIYEIKNGIWIEKNIDNKIKKDFVCFYIDEKKLIRSMNSVFGFI